MASAYEVHWIGELQDRIQAGIHSGIRSSRGPQEVM